MQNKKDLEELKATLKTTPRETGIPEYRDTEDILPSRDPEDIIPIEEDSLRIDDVMKERIIRALEKSQGNRKVAAEMVGISERSLYRKIKEYGLQ
jgi:DNA-binding NtrC family response regulator